MASDLVVRTVFRAVDKVSRTVGKIQQRVTRFANRTSRAMKRLDQKVSAVSSRLSGALRAGFYAAAAGAVALGTAIGGIMRAFSKVEDAQAAFTPLLKSAKRAKEMVDALNQTAATTPFQFETLAGAAKQLLPNMGGDIVGTIEKIRMLGDTAGGNAQKMDSIVRGYNKALLKGKADMESLNMIAEAGVPIFNTLGDVIEKKGSKMFKAISAGKVSTEDITEAFKRMTSEGGIFYKGMKIASEILSGKISTLKDNVGLTAGAFGEALAPTLKELTEYLTEIAAKAREWVNANKDLIKAKVEKYIKLVADNFDRILYWGKKIGGLLVAFYGIVVAVKAVSAVMSVFNAIMMANPIMLIVVAFAAAMAAIWIFRDEIDAFMFKIFDAFAAAGKAIKGFFVGIWEKIRPVVEPVFKFVKTYIGMLVDLFTGRWEEAGKKFLRLWDMIKTAASSALNWILDKLGPIGDAIREIAGFFSGDEGGAPAPVPNQPKIPKTPKAPGPPPVPVVSGLGGGAASRVAAAASGAAVRPQVRTSRTETVAREETEVTLKDETGRAEVTKGGRGRRFKLVHTGAMP